jgi:phytanoyl-CoA hydroxylase
LTFNGDIKSIPQFSENAEEARKFFDQNGFYVERDGLSADECLEIVSAAKSFESYKSGKCSPLMMPHRTEAKFLLAMKNQKIVRRVQQFLGDRVHGMQSEFFFCKPGTRGFALHQDNFYVEAENAAMVSAWTPLVDVTKDKGCLIVYPGTHKLGVLPVRKLEKQTDEGQDPNANDQETIVPSEFKPIDLEMPAGCILFIHSQIVHGSNKNVTDQYRFVLLNTYIKDGIRFRPGYYAQRAIVDLGI